MTDNRFELLTQKAAGNYKAFLYDCDGTLADNMKAHKDSYAKVAAEYNVQIDHAIIDEFAGLPIREVVKEINKRYQSQFDPVEFEEKKALIFYNEFISHTLPITFVVDHLKASAGAVKIGVVSGGSRKLVQKTLEILGIFHLVDTLVCAGDTPKGKPFADPFLHAAEKLGIPPADCLVFEDGDPGTNAAEAAGMQWIRIDKIGSQPVVDSAK